MFTSIKNSFLGMDGPGRIFQLLAFIVVIADAIAWALGRGTFLMGLACGASLAGITYMQFAMMTRKVFDERIRQAMKKHDSMDMEKMMFMTTEMLRARLRSEHIDADKN